MGAEEYILGQDVTELARSKMPKDTVVLSVRLSRDEFTRLEKIAEASNKTMSQIVREALARYASKPDDVTTWARTTVSMGSTGGTSVSWGLVHQVSQGNPVVSEIESQG